jgi:hypothetical protein
MIEKTAHIFFLSANIGPGLFPTHDYTQPWFKSL